MLGKLSELQSFEYTKFRVYIVLEYIRRILSILRILLRFWMIFLFHGVSNSSGFLFAHFLSTATARLSNQSRSLKVQWSAQRSQLAQQDWSDWPLVLVSTTSTRELRMPPLTVWCRDSWRVDTPKDLRRSGAGSTVRHLTCVVHRAWRKDLDGRAPQGKQVTSEPRCQALCVPRDRCSASP